MNRVHSLVRLAPLLAAALVMAGCGYSAGNIHRENIKTVSVEMFSRGRDVYRRGLPMRLTEAVAKRIELDTPYKLTTGNPDTKLTGTIQVIEQQVLSSNPDTGLPREKEVTFVISLRWVDLRTGAVLVEHSNLRVADTYIPDTRFEQDFFVGSEAVINRLARRIVEKMEKDW